MSDTNLQVGDIVQLKSGSLDMTIDSLQASGIWRCVWFDTKGDFKEGYFSPSSLVKVEQSDKRKTQVWKR